MDTAVVPSRKPDLLWRNVDGEIVILSTDSRNLQVFNEVGSRIWSLLDGVRTVSAIAEVICTEYGVQRETVERDILAYLEQLKKLGLVNA